MPPIASEPGPDPITRADYNALISFVNAMEVALDAEEARAAAAEAAQAVQIAALQTALGMVTPAPAAAFSASATSGVVPFTVVFTDATVGAVTTRSWNFGDSTTSTDVSPSKTYTTAGTYTVTLTVTNSGGTDIATQTITASAATGTGEVTYVASGAVAAATTASSAVTLPIPAGLANGDFLIAGFNLDNNPSLAARTVTDGVTTNASTTVTSATAVFTATDIGHQISGTNIPANTTITAVASATSVTISAAATASGTALSLTIESIPFGWSLLAGPLAPNDSMTVWSYFHTVGNAATEPANYTWRLGTAQKWNGAISAFRGCDVNTNPFDTLIVSKQNTLSDTILEIPAITTQTPGAMLVTFVGVNSSGADVSGPTGFTEAWEADGGQTARLAYKAVPTASVQGPFPHTLALTQIAAGWGIALRRSNATAPVTTKLTFPAPTLTNPLTYEVAQNERVITLDVTRDWIVKLPSTPLLVTTDFQIVGGKNVVMIGGEIRFSTDTRCLAILGGTATSNDRTVHVEGVKFSTSNGMRMKEGINVDTRDDTGVTVNLQNIILPDLYGTEATHHCDIIQVFNGPKKLNVDLLEGRTQYQALMIQPGQFGADATFNTYEFKRLRVEMTSISGVGPGYFVGLTNSPFPALTFTDCQIIAPTGFNKLSFGSSSGTPPAPSTTGVTQVASFTGARATAGVGYVSPGYL